jgi:hypothetical protein
LHDKEIKVLASVGLGADLQLQSCLHGRHALHGAQITPLSRPLPSFAYPVLVATFAGWIAVLLRGDIALRRWICRSFVDLAALKSGIPPDLHLNGDSS